MEAPPNPVPVRVRHAGLWVLVAVVLLAAVGFDLIRRRPDPPPPADPAEHASRLLEAGLEREAVGVLQEDALAHPDDIAAHYAYISLALRRQSTRERYRRGDDHELLDFYEGLADTSDGSRRDIAHYALGLCWTLIGEPGRALSAFDSVANRHLPYLNNSEGRARLGLGMTAQAESLFRVEVRLGYNVAGAVHNLADLAVAQGDWKALRTLLADRRTAAYVPPATYRLLLLHQGRLLEYLPAFLATYRMPFTWPHVLIALFCGLIWFLLIRWWDLFEKEPLWLCVLTVVGGFVVANGVYAVNDAVSLVASVGPTGQAVHDYLYYFAAVGIVEETLKLVPVALVFLLTRHIDEPLDWLIYACLSALGFALSENYENLSLRGLHVGISRVFFTTPFHLTLSGLAAMSIPEARFRGQSPVRGLIIALPIVAAVHGTFDILADWNGGAFSILNLGILIVWGVAFMECVNLLGTVSPFRKMLERARFIALPWLIAAFGALCFGIFAVNASRLPHDVATELFKSDVSSGVIVVGVLWIYTRLRIGAASDPRPVQWRRSEPPV